jgi:hypothetical protein
MLKLGQPTRRLDEYIENQVVPCRGAKREGDRTSHVRRVQIVEDADCPHIPGRDPAERVGFWRRLYVGHAAFRRRQQRWAHWTDVRPHRV